MRAVNSAVIVCCLVLIIFLFYACGKFKTEGFSSLLSVPHIISRTKTPIVSDIPFVVYQCWHSNEVPEGMYNTIMDNSRNNPEFEFRIYDDNRCREFIRDNFDKPVLDAFDTLKPGAFKADLWRLCILYKLGGVYLDIKFKIVKPLINLIKLNQTLFVQDLGQNDIYQGLIIAKPNEQCLLSGINKIVENVKGRVYGDHFLEPTGPKMLGPIVKTMCPNNIKFGLIGGDIHKIYLQENPNEILFEQYSTYRYEQKMKGTAHYGDLWYSKQIYND